MTGIDTVLMICLMSLGLAMRDTPPSARMMAGTRSRAMTATAPAFSATSACATLMTSMMTPPLSISASPTFKRKLVLLPLFSDMMFPCSRSRLAVAMPSGTTPVPRPNILHSERREHCAFSWRSLLDYSTSCGSAPKPRWLRVPCRKRGNICASNQWALRRVAVLLLEELREHALRINLDERPRAGRQHFAFGASDLGGSKVLPSVNADFPAFRNQGL